MLYSQSLYFYCKNFGLNEFTISLSSFSKDLNIKSIIKYINNDPNETIIKPAIELGMKNSLSQDIIKKDIIAAEAIFI